MFKNIFTAAAITLGFGTVADAGTNAAPLTYDIFEASIPHMDLETCPIALQTENVFCRATLHHEELHVFVFSFDGDSPMVGFQTFPAEGIETLLN